MIFIISFSKYYKRKKSINGFLISIKILIFEIRNCDMKKTKKYTSKNTESNKANEPMIAYGQSYYALLINMSVHDIAGTNLSGEVILQLQKHTNLSPVVMAGILGVSKSRYYELVASPTLDSKIIDALVDFTVLWKDGIDAFDGDALLLQEWLLIRNQNLGNIKPVDLLTTRVGRRELEKAFLRIEYSVYG